MNNRSIVASAVMIASVFACSSTTPSADGGGATVDGSGGTKPSTSIDCGTASCPSDPAPSAVAKKVCEDALASSCGGLYGLAFDCLAPKYKCGADGKTDAVAATNAVKACAKELDAFSACVNPDSGVGDSGK